MTFYVIGSSSRPVLDVFFDSPTTVHDAKERVSKMLGEGHDPVKMKLVCGGEILSNDSCILDAVNPARIVVMLPRTESKLLGDCKVCHGPSVSCVLTPCGCAYSCLACSCKIKEMGLCNRCGAAVFGFFHVGLDELAPLFASCQRCHSGKISVVNLPCGHANMCPQCASEAHCLQCGAVICQSFKINESKALPNL